MDLTGHGAGGRPLLFARKPAPVQIAMIGYQDTTGLAAMDYRITDDRMDPPGMTEHLYTERLIRLPRSSWCYRPDPLSPPIGPPPCLRNGFITFGCLNRIIKVTAAMLRMWAQILARVPGSRLTLALPGADRLNPSVRARIAGHGIPSDRLDLLDRAPREAYLERYGSIDIALDTFPYAGATTTCDALWMGVPVVSLVGTTNVSRTGAGVLPHAGLDDLVCGSPEEYVETAVRLAGDRPRLGNLRRELRARMTQCALLDQAGYTRAVELAFRAAWTASRGN